MSKNKLLSIINAPEPIKVIWAINKTIKGIRNKNSEAGKMYGDISSSIMSGSNTVCKKYFLLFLHGQKRSIRPKHVFLPPTWYTNKAYIPSSGADVTYFYAW